MLYAGDDPLINGGDKITLLIQGERQELRNIEPDPNDDFIDAGTFTEEYTTVTETQVEQNAHVVPASPKEIVQIGYPISIVMLKIATKVHPELKPTLRFAYNDATYKIVNAPTVYEDVARFFAEKETTRVE